MLTVLSTILVLSNPTQSLEQLPTRKIYEKKSAILNVEKDFYAKKKENCVNEYDESESRWEEKKSLGIYAFCFIGTIVILIIVIHLKSRKYSRLVNLM